MHSTAIINVGTMVSGDVEHDTLDAEALIVEEGKIKAIGKAGDIGIDSAHTVIDAKGTTLIPGLIDSHCHPCLLKNGPFSTT